MGDKPTEGVGASIAAAVGPASGEGHASGSGGWTAPHVPNIADIKSLPNAEIRFYALSGAIMSLAANLELRFDTPHDKITHYLPASSVTLERVRDSILPQGRRQPTKDPTAGVAGRAIAMDAIVFVATRAVAVFGTFRSLSSQHSA